MMKEGHEQNTEEPEIMVGGSLAANDVLNSILVDLNFGGMVRYCHTYNNYYACGGNFGGS